MTALVYVCVLCATFNDICVSCMFECIEFAEARTTLNRAIFVGCGRILQYFIEFKMTVH